MSVWKGSVIKLIYHNIFLFLLPYTALRKSIIVVQPIRAKYTFCFTNEKEDDKAD
jgi:hypothetical protein